MKYKLEFIKLSSDHKFAGVGFAGNIFMILNELCALSARDTLYVDMETNECVCTQQDLNIFNTNNSWEYYFDQCKLEDTTLYNKIHPGYAHYIRYDDRESFTDPTIYIELKNKFYKNFQIKLYLQKLIDDFYNKNIKDKITLGVQVRLTDMKYHHNVASINVYIDKIKEIIKENSQIEQVFIASDDIEAINVIKNSLNIPVIFYENMFRADKNNAHINPYDRYNSERLHHRYKLGVECAQEIFTLCKVDYMLKADVSAISIVACILSDNIKKIYKL